MRAHLAWLEGLGLYLKWWLQALARARDPRAPLGARRLLVLVAGMPLFLLIQLGHGLALLLDEVLFPGYRRRRVDRALFIIGVPRSATTFAHRTLARDDERYTTFKAWELLLAPALCQRRLLRALGAADRRLGGWGQRGARRLIERFAGAWDGIHEVRLEAPEEDYLALLPAGGCFVLLLAFPAAAAVQGLGDLEGSLSASRRRRLLALYEGCLKRHLHDDGGGRILLSKNAALSSWLGTLARRFPRARFLVTLRDPRRALSSQVSAVARAGQALGTDPTHPRAECLFVEHYAAGLSHLETALESLPRRRAAVVDAGDLHQAPGATLAAALAQLGEPVSGRLRDELIRLDQATPAASGHPHDPARLDCGEAVIRTRLLPPYHALLRGVHRARPGPVAEVA